MADFFLTPTHMNLIQSAMKNNVTGRWSMPILTFNTRVPYFIELDPLNADPVYQQQVIDNFYFRLKEKWLYNSREFRSLLKFFKVNLNGSEGTVELVDDPEKPSDIKPDKNVRRQIFRYIEKYLITKKFISKVLHSYVSTYKVKWYNLFSNTDILKGYLAHKLKKFIKNVIYELHDVMERVSEVMSEDVDQNVNVKDDLGSDSSSDSGSDSSSDPSSDSDY